MPIDKKSQEIDSLWHYAFYDQADAIHKIYDTFHNLSDVNDMKKEKKDKYILRRIPKLNALSWVLQQHQMTEPLSLLKRRWQEVG